MCIKMYGQLFFATTLIIFLSNVPPEISLIISAPSSSDLLAILDRKVSIEITKSGNIFLMCFKTGMTLVNSSSTLIFFAPGFEL